MKEEKLSLVEFGQKLREVLGNTQEGRELTVIDVADFYKLFCASSLSFNEWLKKEQSNKVDVPVVCSECGCPMEYCIVCDTYHHADSFKQDHEDFQRQKLKSCA